MFHKYPYTDLHELNLDWIIAQLKRFPEGYDAPDYVGGQYSDHTRYYIACNSGSDDNDGLTAETAFQTLDKLLDKVNGGLVDARCYFIEPGNYYFTHQFISNVVLHLAPTVNGVNIVFDYQDQEAFYFQNCHVKFGRDTDPYQLNIYTPGHGITAEGGEMAFYYTTVHDKYYQFGGYINTDYSGFEWLRFAGTSGTLSNLTILNTNPAVWAIYLLRCASIYLANDITFTNLSSAGTDWHSAMCHVSQGSNLYINCSRTADLENKYYYAIHSQGGQIWSYKGRYNAFIADHAASSAVGANRMTGFFITDETPGYYGEDVSADVEVI